MKSLPFVALTLFCVCAIVQSRKPESWMPQGRKPQITYTAAEEALRRAPKVPAGLTISQVWARLGLAKFAEPQLGRGSGPISGYWENYELTDRHRITLTIDFSVKPPIVKKVQGTHLPKSS